MTSPPVAAPMSAKDRFSATAMACAAVLTLVDTVTGHHAIALAALVLLVLYIIAGWHLVRTSSRIMVYAAVAVAILFLLMAGTIEKLSLAASRALYLPALVATMTLLRAAAQQSGQVQAAAHFVVDQPPRRRFWLLAAGGQIFGVLLNVGGLQMLLRIALAGAVRENEDPAISEIRTRRITNAVMRGFTATVLWSPVGVAINLILPLMPTIGWIDYLPYGLGMLVLFLSTGWVLDFMEPQPRTRAARSQHEGAAGSVIMLVGLLLAITGSAALAELLFGTPIRAAILVVVPLAAIAWTLVTHFASPATGFAAFGINSFRALPGSVSEICMMASTSFLGLLIADMIPLDAVRAVVSGLNAGPGAIACMTVVIIPLLSLVGINPFITGTAVVGSLLAARVAIPETMLMAAALSGWCCAMVVSPVTATVAIAAGATGKSVVEVGPKWSGKFVVVFAGLSLIVFGIWGSLS